MSTPTPKDATPVIPPLNIRQVIEKSVSYIIKNGSAFEEKLKQNDANGQFAFLSPEDPHYSYYKSRLAAESSRDNSEKPNNSINGGTAEKIIEKPRDLLFLTELPPISNHDLEVIKTTALYVACNSSKHQEAFQKHMDRKGRRNQFAFMHKTHTLHRLFQNYVAQYKAIIGKVEGTPELPSTALIDSYLSTEASELFEKAYSRAAYEKRHKIKEKSREQDIKNRQMHYASIDWQDFSFVAKVSFDAVDEVSELAVPLSRESVLYRSLEAKNKNLELDIGAAKVSNEAGTKGDTPAKTREHDAENETKNGAAPPANVPKGMKIKAAGESRLKRKANEQKSAQKDAIRCPITGNLVAESEFDMHLKTLLRDPRYKEQQENFMRKNFTYASNLTTDQVYENIKRLVRKRGQSEEEEEADRKRINLGK